MEGAWTSQKSLQYYPGPQNQSVLPVSADSLPWDTLVGIESFDWQGWQYLEYLVHSRLSADILNQIQVERNLQKSLAQFSRFAQVSVPPSFKYVHVRYCTAPIGPFSHIRQLFFFFFFSPHLWQTAGTPLAITCPPCPFTMYVCKKSSSIFSIITIR